MMARDIGDKRNEIWLLGDSNPKRWENTLRSPLDPRHPIRHNIWTAVIDVVQDRVFRELGRRVDCSELYTRNAVQDPKIKPDPNQVVWGGKLAEEVKDYSQALAHYRPKLVFCFGAFAFEFGRRALNGEPDYGCGHWGAEELGLEFLRRIDSFSPREVNLIPLLHRSISGGKFIESHEYFCANGKGANYFDYVGRHIAEQLIKYHQELHVWIE